MTRGLAQTSPVPNAPACWCSMSSMKIGMNLLLWTTHLDRSHEPLLRNIRGWGFDGVEVPLFSVDQLNAAWAAEAIRGAGLEVTTVAALPPDASLVSDSGEEHRKALAFLRRAVDATRRLGATMFCGPLYSPVGRLLGRGRSDDEWKRGVANLREVARIAADGGVRIAIEPLNRFETYVLNTVGDTRAILDEVGSDSLGVLVDTFHANIEEKRLGDAVRAAGPRLFHVHASDNDRGICGSGHVPWDELFTSLRRSEYKGWIGVESFSQSLPEIAAATAIWRPLAPSSEVFAKDSLKFLRGKAASAAA